MAEGEEDCVERQSLRLVDGEDANSSNRRTWNRALAELLVPGCEESLNIGSNCAAKVVL